MKRLVMRVLSYVRERIEAGNPDCVYRRALDEAMGLARLSADDLSSVDFNVPVDEWPPIETILNNLSRDYSRLLDIRIVGQPADHLLWDAVDVPNTFAAATADPDCEHYCIAILVLEGVLEDVATANWDGLIEAAAGELSEGSGAVLRVCVRAEELRQPPLLARLLKFHGCAVLAGADPTIFRPLLIARLSQITEWSARKRGYPDQPVSFAGGLSTVFDFAVVLARWFLTSLLPKNTANDMAEPISAYFTFVFGRPAYPGATHQHRAIGRSIRRFAFCPSRRRIACRSRGIRHRFHRSEYQAS